MNTNRNTPGFGLIQRVQVLAQCGDDTLILAGVLAEYVLEWKRGRCT